MNNHLEPKISNVSFRVMHLTNSVAKAGPMSGAQPMSAASVVAEASALGLGCVTCLDLAYFESQADLFRINQRYLKRTYL